MVKNAVTEEAVDMKAPFQFVKDAGLAKKKAEEVELARLNITLYFQH